MLNVRTCAVVITSVCYHRVLHFSIGRLHMRSSRNLLPGSLSSSIVMCQYLPPVCPAVATRSLELAKSVIDTRLALASCDVQVPFCPEFWLCSRVVGSAAASCQLRRAVCVDFKGASKSTNCLLELCGVCMCNLCADVYLYARMTRSSCQATASRYVLGGHERHCCAHRSSGRRQAGLSEKRYNQSQGPVQCQYC